MCKSKAVKQWFCEWGSEQLQTFKIRTEKG